MPMNIFAGRWSSDAVAIVVGDITSHSLDQNRRAIIQKFVQNGGSFFGIKRGCSLLLDNVLQSSNETGNSHACFCFAK